MIFTHLNLNDQFLNVRRRSIDISPSLIVSNDKGKITATTATTKQFQQQQQN